PDPCAACVGIAWADAKHDGGLQAAGSTKREGLQLEHTPAAIDAWGTTLRPRFHGPRGAVCLARHHGPLVFALRTDDVLILFPPPPPARGPARPAAPPRRATAAPPPMPPSRAHCCAPIATRCRLSSPNAPPGAPSRHAAHSVAAWAATQCTSRTAS